MLLRIISPKESKENPSTKKPKNILVLEDTPRYTEKLKRKFKKEKHNITYANSLDKFTKIIEKDGKTFDIVSLDNNIKGELLAEKVSALVRYHAPDAKLGLISGQIAEEEIKFFQDLGFDFFIKKRKTDDLDSKVELWETIAKYLKDQFLL